MNTLALSTPSQDGSGWDIYADASGQLAVNTGGLAIAQDVASAVRVFQGESWYNAAAGVPYFQRIFGGARVSLQFVKQCLISAGSIVPGVSSIVCYLTGPNRDRTVGGQLQIYSNGSLVGTVQTGSLGGVLPWWVNSAADFTT